MVSTRPSHRISQYYLNFDSNSRQVLPSKSSARPFCSKHPPNQAVFKPQCQRCCLSKVSYRGSRQFCHMLLQRILSYFFSFYYSHSIIIKVDMKKHSKNKKTFPKNSKSQPKYGDKAKSIRRNREQKPMRRGPRQQNSKWNNKGRSTDSKKPMDSKFTPQVTHKQQNKLSKDQLREQSVLSKIVIEEQLKKQQPNFQKIKQYLTKIKSRGSKQRLRNKAMKLMKDSNTSAPANF